MTAYIPYSWPDYAAAAAWACVLGALLYWRASESDRPALIGVWALKCLVTLVAIPWYERRYFGFDEELYFAHATAPDFVWRGLRLGSGTDNMGQLTWLHLHVVPGSQLAVKVGFSMLTLLALYIFYRAAVLFRQREDLRLFFLLSLFPSVLFWGSTLGKEAVALLGVALWAHGTVGLILRPGPRPGLILSAGVLIAALIRPWMGPILLAPTALLAVRLVRGGVLRAALLLGLAGFSVFCVYRVGPTLSALLTARALALETFAGGGSSFAPAALVSVGDVLRELPAGVLRALLRPLPGDAPGIAGLLAGLENAALLLLLGAAAFRSRRSDWEHPLVQATVLLLVCWAAVYGLTVYNFGALARYKVQVWPLLLFLGLRLARNNK